MSKANKLASLAVDVNNLSELADQVTDIENAIVRANTNAQLIGGIADDIEALEANTALIMNELSVANSVEVPQQLESFRNKIINGNFDIWQRGTSQTSSGYGSADRWQNYHIGSTKTASQQAFTVGQTDVPGNPKYYLRHVVSSVAGSGNRVLVNQKIEGVTTLAGQTVTLSFWAKADSNKNIATEFVYNFGTGGSPSTVITGIQVITHSLTTSWQKFTATVAIPSISGKTIGSDNNDYISFAFWFEAGSDFNSRTNSLGQQSGTFDIAQVQLEEGEVATPFEHRSIGIDQELCNRYYQKGSFHMKTYRGFYGNWTESWPVQFRTQMRAAPSLSHSASISNLNYANFSNISQNSFTYYTNVAGNGDISLTSTWSADAEL